MLVISKRHRQSLGIKVSTISIRIVNLDLVLATALVVFVALAVLALVTALVAFVAQVASAVAASIAVAASVVAASIAVAVGASKQVNRLVFYMRRSPALSQGSFTIR